MLRVEGLKKVFRSGASELVLFENLSFAVKRGEMLAIVGESGAGKSTLLHILSALDRASAGDVYCAHLHLNSLTQDQAADFRNRETGFVWQFHYLLPEFTAAENVAMPLLMRGQSWQQVEPEAMRWLRQVGLEAARPSSLRRAFWGRTAAGGSGEGAHHRSQAFIGGRAHRRPGRAYCGSGVQLDCAVAYRASTHLPGCHAQSGVRAPLPSRSAYRAWACAGDFAGIVARLRAELLSKAH